MGKRHSQSRRSQNIRVDECRCHPPKNDTSQHKEQTQESTPINRKCCIQLLPDDEISDDVKTTPGAKKLLGLFEVPTGNDSSDRLRWTSSNTQATPERTNKKTGQHLMDLFSESSSSPTRSGVFVPKERIL
jgi:hypothetical protein